MSTELRLYDTRSRAVRPFVPRDPGRVGIYACGPTVYSRIHVGNARPFVVFSLLKRFLEHAGYEVCLVINVTDVNDKIYAAAGGGSSIELAAAMTEAYFADTERLGLGAPTTSPWRASRSARSSRRSRRCWRTGTPTSPAGMCTFACAVTLATAPYREGRTRLRHPRGDAP